MHNVVFCVVAQHQVQPPPVKVTFTWFITRTQKENLYGRNWRTVARRPVSIRPLFWCWYVISPLYKVKRARRVNLAGFHVFNRLLFAAFQIWYILHRRMFQADGFSSCCFYRFGGGRRSLFIFWNQQKAVALRGWLVFPDLHGIS